MLGDLVESMKKAALDAVDNSDPTCIMYGKVIKVSPLEIQVNQKLILKKEQLVLTRDVTDYTIKVKATTHTVEQNPDGLGMTHIFGSPEGGGTSHAHGISEIKILNALKVGEEVILIRQSGGQEYIVLDRVGS